MLNLKINDIAFITGLKRNGLLEKASRQQWEYSEQSHPGSPLKSYSLDRLPDEIQIAYVEWSQNKYEAVVAKENAKSNGRPDSVPKPIDTPKAKQALSWPTRREFFKETCKSERVEVKRGRSQRVYNGVSRGLCPEARRQLLEKFPELSDNSYSKEEPSVHDSNDISMDSLYQKLVGEKERTIRLQYKQIAYIEQENKRLTDENTMLKEKLSKLELIKSTG